jgi:hypothetical protein
MAVNTLNEQNRYLKTENFKFSHFWQLSVKRLNFIPLIRHWIFFCYKYCHVLGWLLDGFWIRWLYLLTPYTHYFELQAVTALSLIYTLYSSPLHTHTHTHILVSSVFTSRILATDFNIVVMQVYDCSTYEVFFAQPNSFLAISSQSSFEPSVIRRVLTSWFYETYLQRYYNGK